MMQRGAGSKKRITLKDIAYLAKVSVPTASLVLSGKGPASRISAEVGHRVRQVALEHDYTPNLLVRSMQQGRTNILSFYSAFQGVPEISRQHNLYMDRLYAAILYSAALLDYDLLTFCRVSPSAEEVYQSLNGRRADGLLFFGPTEGDPLLELLRRSQLPTVILNHVDTHGEMSYVTDDVESGMRQVAEVLLAHGHRRIGAVASVLSGADASMRIALLRRFLNEAGMDLPDRLIVYAGQVAGQSPKEALQRLLAESEPPTAVFCWHDMLGYELLEACDDLGVMVPKQLSLIGYDGLQWSSSSRHQLASVVVDINLSVQTAVDFLDCLVKGEPGPLRATLPVALAPGTTLGSPG